MNSDNRDSFDLRRFVAAYGMAIVLVVAALALTLLIWTAIKAIPSPLFLFAIVLTAWLYGTRPGVFATLLSGIAIDYFFVSPQYQLSGNWDDILRLVIFGIEGYILCWIISWRTKANREVQESREELRALSLRQQTLLETERKRISLEIHDELGQELTGLKLDLRMLGKKLSPESMTNVGNELDHISGLVDRSIQTVRRIATELRPPILDDLGLVPALEWQSEEFQKRTGMTCLMKVNIGAVDIVPDVSTAVFRIFQEALTNVARHAVAKTVIIDLKAVPQNLVLRIEDDGKGIEDPQDGRLTSLGILGMRERARSLGGSLEVLSAAGRGTVVELTAPL